MMEFLKRLLAKRNTGAGPESIDFDKYLLEHGCCIAPFQLFLANPCQAIVPAPDIDSFKIYLDAYLQTYSTAFVFKQPAGGDKFHYYLGFVSDGGIVYRVTV